MSGSKDIWKLLLAGAAAVFALVTIYYTNQLSQELAREERKKIELWANAYKHLNDADENTDIGFLSEVFLNNTTVPVILTNEHDSIIFWRNLDSARVAIRSDYLPKQLKSMKKSQAPIIIQLDDGTRQYIYYKDSFPLVKLKYYPFLQFFIIGIFLLAVYIAFTNSRIAEQNRIWIGMAKETAHQLGTPISSLAAWLELLKESNKIEPEAVNEIEKDVARLEIIADRFSKIGSAPLLEKNDVCESIRKSVDYIKKRASVNVDFSFHMPPHPVDALFNPPLFDWVMENLLKNALDAMQGKGAIVISVTDDQKQVIIDVKDHGKGIPKSKFDTVFQPGYSTKKRGWGLGLTLVKRIIEHYHHGKVFVKDSELGKGTTFRVILNKKP